MFKTTDRTDATCQTVRAGSSSETEGWSSPGLMLLQVRLKEYGSQLIELADNGNGVSPEDYQALTLKYHTSKINDFKDLSVRLRGSTRVLSVLSQQGAQAPCRGAVAVMSNDFACLFHSNPAHAW